jgi:hypothetical protein
MSLTNTNYNVTDNVTDTDLINIFQINPVGSGTTILPPPFTYTVSPDISYVSGYYVLTFRSTSIVYRLTINNGVTSPIYFVVVGGGGAGSSHESSSQAIQAGQGGGGGGVFNGYFTNNSSPLNIAIGLGGSSPAASGGPTYFNSDDLHVNIQCDGGKGGNLIGGTFNGQAYNTIPPNPPYVIPINQSIYGPSGGLGYNETLSIQILTPTNGLNGLNVYIPPTNFTPSYFGGSGGGGGGSIDLGPGSFFTASLGGGGGVGGGGNGATVITNNTTGTTAGYPAQFGVGGTGGGGGGGSTISGIDPNVYGSCGFGGSGVVIVYFKFP